MGQSSQRSQPATGEHFRLALLICAALYFADCLGCASWQRRLIYYPPVFTTEQVDAFARAAKLERWRNPAGQAVGMKRLSPTQPAEGRVFLDYLRRYHGPVGVFVGGKDNVVPEQFGRRLYEGYAGPKRIWEFSEANHWTVTQRTPGDWKEVLDFWRGKNN